MAFEKLIGNSNVKTLLKNAVQTNNILHSYLFSGIDGIGKGLFAKEFAHMILCTSNETKPCGICKSCLEFQGGSHPDFLVIEPEDGKTIKIEQIRYLQEKIAEKPVTAKKKVYVINNSDTMTREASNALLKTLEEPPTYAVLILITANESKLLVTIKSRCTKVAFQPLSEENIKKYFIEKLLAENKIEENSPTNHLGEISVNMIKQSQGSLGRLLKIVEEQDTYTKVEQVVNILEKEDITQIWREAEVLYGAKENILDLLDYMNVIFFEKLRTSKDTKYTKEVSIIEEAKKRITANANYDMTIDNLLLKLWEEFR